MSDSATSPADGGGVSDVAFRLECYGGNDSRVLRYFNGAIIREAALKDYFTARSEVASSADACLDSVLERGNNENWHISASTICVAASIWAQKSNPVEWDEARVFQQNANQVFAKAHALLDCLQSSRRLQLSHTVPSQEINSQVAKYAIHSRNDRLRECAGKARELHDVLSRSLRLQVNFLKVISAIKSQFKVLINARNLVDVSSFDVDYPASFSVFVVFYDMALNMDDGESRVWESWDVHKLSSPAAPQHCLLSYYEDTGTGDGLMTKMTFPTAVSFFIEHDFALTVNGAHVPVYIQEDHIPVIYRLRRAQMCLIDRFIFLTMCQAALEPLRSQQAIPVDDTQVFIQSMTSERISFMFDDQVISVRYATCGDEEVGDVVWRLAVTKLRDLAIQNWKRQLYERESDTPCLLLSFLGYVTNLLTKFSTS
ncbi:transcriptional family protein, putative [Babesia ovata]|uniref:Transcriptional family protein, putative n=1 Tax=Babesia ovata TaxID=189622 RepID=A0A2H6KFA6_9APIC|nr:transcriptional family protein, putative [Babesia ovata]GBE61664.1 transcriptional family protein, putative [Babesia ovata]